MNDRLEISDELLNAFADDELDVAEKARLLDRMAEDGDLRGRVCQLWQVKEMLRGAYPEPEAPSAPPLRRPSRWQRWGHALAAAVVLCVGTVAGWFAHGDAGAAAHVGGLQLYARQMDEGKVILHLSSAAPDRLKTALDEADELSRSNDRSGHPMQVEVLANGDGLSLMRSDVSPYAERIAALKRAHPNLKFIACNNAMEMLRLSGVEVMLLPEVSVAPSAIDEIMMRLQQGWAYVRV